MATSSEAASPDVGRARSSASSGGGVASLLRSLSCRRRSHEERERLTLEEYAVLLERGRNLDEKRRFWYDKLSWWSDVPTKKGTRAFCLAPRGPKGQTEYPIDMWELFAYCLTKMHDHVVTDSRPFAVVWVQLSDHRVGLLDFRRLKASLHPKYGENLEAVHVVHPSWTVRVLRILLWPIAEDELWERFQTFERVEFVDAALDSKFRFPKDIYEYDKVLDKQAQEVTEQANKRFGSGTTTSLSGLFGPTPAEMSEQDMKSKEQMAEMTRLLQERGFAGKDKGA